jgi:hypothetical protein
MGPASNTWEISPTVTEMMATTSSKRKPVTYLERDRKRFQAENAAHAIAEAKACTEADERSQRRKDFKAHRRLLPRRSSLRLHPACSLEADTTGEFYNNAYQLAIMQARRVDFAEG